MKYAIETKNYGTFHAPAKATIAINDNMGKGFDTPEEAMIAMVGEQEMLETTFAMRYPFSRVIEYSTKTAHTPAPWIVEVSRATPKGPDRYTVKRPDDSQRIAYMGENSMHPDFNTRTRANAALIAAAPELLDALKSLVSQYKEVAGIHADFSHYESIIAKAEGRGE